MAEEIKNNEAQNTEEPKRDVPFEEALEAVLFAAGHPIPYATLGRVLEMTPLKVKERVMKYAEAYNNSPLPRGVILLTYADSCQLCTKSEYLYEIREALGIKKSGTLSTASLEVLAIVAYNQPVTRAFVDTLRRVDSSYAMNNLIDRGLIESKGRLDVPGRPMLYGTTSDFLRCFGINDLSELPKTSDEMIDAFNNAKTGENSKNGQNDIDGAEQLVADIDSVMPEEDTSTGETSNDTSTNEPEVSESQMVEELDTSAEDDIIND